MQSIKSFLAAFYLLDQCYWIEQTDPLGMLLGMMNPERWEDGHPADLVLYEDWRDRAGKKEITEENLLEAVISYVEYYGKYLDFNFSQTLKILRTQIGPPQICLAIQRAQEKFEKHPQTYSREAYSG